MLRYWRFKGLVFLKPFLQLSGDSPVLTLPVMPVKCICSGKGNSILRKFHMCSWDVKLTLFRAYCSPLYTAQLWWSHKRASINRLKVTYHNLFKMFLGLPKYESTSLLCTALDVQCCQAVIRRLIYSFMVRLAATKNSIMTAMYTTAMYTTCTTHHGLGGIGFTYYTPALDSRWLSH